MPVALLRASHPGPAFAVTALTVILGAGLGLGLDPVRLILVGLAMLAGQLSIGWSNDWIDADRDRAVERSDKPIATGAVSLALVRTAALIAAAAVIPLSFALGPWAGIVNVVGVASGWSYNAWLKRTVLSGLPYLVTFGLLPLFVTTSLPEPHAAAPWAIAAGALLGFGAHFANVLPDLQDDARTGVSGLPHRIGRIGSGIFAFGSLAISAVLIAFGPTVSGIALTSLGYFALIANLVIAAAGSYLVLTRPPTRLLFQLIIASALLDVALLALAGSAILA
jgi:4-hydroxybenzoate polyprenyltransferase